MEQIRQPKIEIGYGSAACPSSFETGFRAAEKAMETVRIHDLSAVIVYASVNYNLSEVLQGVCSLTGEAQVFGTTTAGEICNGHLGGSVLVVVLASPYLRVNCGVGTNVSADWRGALHEAIWSSNVSPFFSNINEYSRKIARDGRNIFIMLFSPGNTRYSYSHSFEILEQLKKESLGVYPVIGGSSAENWDMGSNSVFLGTEVFQDGILLVVFETELQFGISITHGFQPTDLKMTVTSVEGYEVLTLDGSTSVETLSRLLDTSREKLSEEHCNIVLGINDPMGQFRTSTVCHFTPRGGIDFASQVQEGTVLTVMDPASPGVADAGTEALRKAIIRGGITDPAVSFVHYCALRPLIIGEKYSDEITNMAEMVTGKPLVGFFSYGEQGVADDGICRHNNSSIACLVLGNELSQMARIASESNRLLKEIMEYDQLKSEFFSNISHEFRTPINVILGTLQLMELQASPGDALMGDEKASRHIRIMKQNCYRLLRMTNNLIDITRIEAGFFEMTLHNSNIVQVVEDITLSVAEYIENKGLELVFDTDVEERIMAVDADKIERIMLNLLSNAVKFSKTGGRISVGIQDKGQSVRIAVSDTGIGIPKDKLNIIFERFRQVDSSLSRDHEGSGIGLSLVKNLVELHGGTIGVESDYGNSTEFIIDLPVRLIADETNVVPVSSKDYIQRITMEFSDIYAATI